ncbi:hypothetical protein RFI_25555, partial [Reticulomyxa filosa]
MVEEFIVVAGVSANMNRLIHNKFFQHLHYIEKLAKIIQALLYFVWVLNLKLVWLVLNHADNPKKKYNTTMSHNASHCNSIHMDESEFVKNIEKKKEEENVQDEKQNTTDNTGADFMLQKFQLLSLVIKLPYKKKKKKTKPTLQMNEHCLQMGPNPNLQKRDINKSKNPTVVSDKNETKTNAEVNEGEQKDDPTSHTIHMSPLQDGMKGLDRHHMHSLRLEKRCCFGFDIGLF